MSKIDDHSIQGGLDGFDGTTLHGWVYLQASPDTPASITLFIDDEVVGSTLAAEHRPDLLAIGLPADRGFRFQVAEKWLDGKPHFVEIRLNGRPILGSPKDLQFPRLSSAIRQHSFAGYLDGVTAGVVECWAIDLTQPGVPVFIDLFVDGNFVRTVRADQFRPDLCSFTGSSGYNCARIAIPRRYRDNKAHIVEVLVAGTDVQLSNSPGTHIIAGVLCETDEPDRRNLARQYFARSPSENHLPSLSVVLPTYNRSALLEGTIRACMQHAMAARLDVEFIVIDDGSADDTPEVLSRLASEFKNLQFERVSNRGPGQCRNLGASKCTHDVVLFIGDDTRPHSPDFLTAHLAAHKSHDRPNVAVLGKMIWPNSREEDVTFVMSHIQGAGQQQFGFYALQPYTWLDWRFFYTSNVSVKRGVVGNWMQEGFSASFTLAAYEDAEFAYRLTKHHKEGFGVLYVPASVATHHHPYDTRGFIRRQAACGKMARVFLDLHPEVAPLIGVAEVMDHLNRETYNDVPVNDVLAMLDGLKAWPIVIERTQRLGSQNWHADLLSAVFELAYLEAFVGTQEGSNFGAGYLHLLELFQQRMSRAVSIELFGASAAFSVVGA